MQLVAAARRRSDGAFGGYSIVILDPTTDQAQQDDTLVMPEHRGHRLGLRLKLANLEIMESEYPGRTAIHTWSATDNAPCSEPTAPSATSPSNSNTSSRSVWPPSEVEESIISPTTSVLRLRTATR